jgi:TonB family protein
MHVRFFGLLLLLRLPLSSQPADPAPGNHQLAQEGPTSPTLHPKQPKPEIQAFLAARKIDICAGRVTPHRETLMALAASKNPTERMWALCRLVEAGDLSQYQEFGKAAVLHVSATVQPRGGHGDSKVGKASQVIGWGAPEAWAISPDSTFWKSLSKTLEQDPNASIDQGLYSVWCYNTLPSQRGLIDQVARQIKSSISLKPRSPDPWNDPRFWIVTDWAIAWGAAEDFDRLEQLIQDPLAKREFSRRVSELKKLQAYLPCLAENQARLHDTSGDANRMEGIPDEMASLLRMYLAAPSFSFSKMKVKTQPPAPAYPTEARMRRMTGEMAVEITIDPTGVPCMVRVKPGPFLAFFAPTSLKYAETWRFEPATLNGVPQRAKFLLTMPFRLR